MAGMDADPGAAAERVWASAFNAAGYLPALEAAGDDHFTTIIPGPSLTAYPGPGDTEEGRQLFGKELADYYDILADKGRIEVARMALDGAWYSVSQGRQTGIAF